jgi:hypothetical protein
MDMSDNAAQNKTHREIRLPTGAEDTGDSLATSKHYWQVWSIVVGYFGSLCFLEVW